MRAVFAIIRPSLRSTFFELFLYERPMCFLLQGRAAACSIKLVYLDEDVRIVEDKTGDLFVYTRPVVSRL